MPRIKSLIIRTKPDVAKKAHNCQANAQHRIERGDKRLNIRNGRGWDYYCLECAMVIVKRDVATLYGLYEKLECSVSAPDRPDRA